MSALSTNIDDRFNKIFDKQKSSVRSSELKDALETLRDEIRESHVSTSDEFKLELLPKQLAFMESKAPTIIYRGGIRSGKTFIGAIWSVKKCIQGQSVLGIAPTYKMAIDNMVATLMLVCDMMGVNYRWNQSRMKFYVGSSYIIFRTAEKYDSIRGFEVCHMWFDEISFTPYAEKAYKRGLGRLSGMNRFKGAAQTTITSSSNGYDYAFDLSELEDSELIIQPIRHNWNLSPEFIKRLYREYSGKFIKQELDAEIVDFSGEFFDTSNIRFVDTMNLTTGVQAFDFAFTTNKTSDFTAHAIGGQHLDGFGVPHVNQWKTDFPKTKEIMRDIIAKTPEFHPYVEANGTQKGYYDILINEGIRVSPITDVNKSKPLRMIPLSNAIGNGEIIFKKASWNEEVLNQLKKFRIDDSHDHDDLIDAINYCYLKSGFYKPSKRNIKLPCWV